MLFRSGRIAHQLKQQIIGVIENMSGLQMPGSESVVPIFGAGGGEETARRLSTLIGADVPLLAKVPFDISLREGGDQGQLIVNSMPESSAARMFYDIADQLTVRKKSLLGVRLGLST